MRLCLFAALAALLLVVNPAVLDAEEVLKPTKAYSAYLKEIRQYSQSEKAEEGKRIASEYLAAWAASGRKPTPTDNYVLAQFQQVAGEYVKALAGFHRVQGDREVKEKTRDYAAKAEAGILLVPEMRTAIGNDGVAKATAGLCKYAAAMEVPARLKARSTLRRIIAQVYENSGRAKDAHEMRMQLVQDDPSFLSKLARPIAQGFLNATHSMAEYDGLRKQAAVALGILRSNQQAAIDKARKKYGLSVKKLRAAQPDALDGEGNLKKTKTKGMTPQERAVFTAKRSLASAEAVLASMAGFEKPLELLGKPAAKWSLENAFGDIEFFKELEGKVVVLDFFSTMFDHINFAIMRDLVKTYGEKGLVVVGVTVTGKVCYAQRFAGDEDMKNKPEARGRLFYAARLASEDAPADGEYILAEAAYRARELETITEFIGNHEMTWPVVMIGKDEPGAKYGQETWPHLVVLDKQSRIRYLRGGSIKRADTVAVAGLRKVIEDLLAE